MTFKRALSCTLLGGTMLLTACGNDDKRLDPKQVAGIIRQGVQDRYNPPPDRDKDAIIEAASREALTLAAPEDPLASIRFDSVGIAAVLRRIEVNGQHIVWAAWGSSDRKSIITKNGMITATRGLRKDLMSAESDPVLELVRNREEGNVPYTLRYLDGDFVVVEAKYTCTISRGYDKTVALASGPTPALQMFSSCVSANRQFVDLFLVDYSGHIIEM
ncbi:MAG: YjbF family lipoprotein, partial [Pseudomonadota bacterium]